LPEGMYGKDGRMQREREREKEREGGVHCKVRTKALKGECKDGLLEG
jgi:hypothetical protein